MTQWMHTQEAADFIATGEIRKTSPEIMEAITFFARNLDEAERVWKGEGLGRICHLVDVWEYVTGNGMRNASDYVWGADGDQWFPTLPDAA